MYRKLLRMALLTCALAGVLAMTSTSQALVTSTKYRWEHGSWVHFKIDPNLDGQLRNSTGNLGVSGAIGEVRASKDEWNNSTGFTLIETGWTDTKGGRIRVQDLGIVGSLINTNCAQPGWIAVTCYDSLRAGLFMNNIEMVYNQRFRFTTNRRPFRAGDGTLVYSVHNIGRHEFGHWPGLDDEYLFANGDPNSTMNNWDLPVSEGDKRGVTQWYGPYTSFDYWTADGIKYPNNEDAKYQPGRKDVANYLNNAGSVPELSPVFASSETSYNNVRPAHGDKMERFAGTSRSTYSYAYYPLFSQADDRHKQGRMRIVPGMQLKWNQYSYQQTTFSIDAEFTDGTTLRDLKNAQGQYLIVDQNRVPLHAKERRYGTGTWHYFVFDLSPAAGKEVRRWFIVYDNQNTQWVGQFRAYFDNVRLAWPNSPKQ